MQHLTKMKHVAFRIYMCQTCLASKASPAHGYKANRDSTALCDNRRINTLNLKKNQSHSWLDHQKCFGWSAASCLHSFVTKACEAATEPALTCERSVSSIWNATIHGGTPMHRSVQMKAMNYEEISRRSCEQLFGIGEFTSTYTTASHTVHTSCARLKRDTNVAFMAIGS